MRFNNSFQKIDSCFSQGENRAWSRAHLHSCTLRFIRMCTCCMGVVGVGGDLAFLALAYALDQRFLHVHLLFGRAGLLVGMC